MPLLLVFVITLLTGCRDPEPKPIPTSTECEAGFILDGSSCVPESCGTGRWGSLPVDHDTVYVDMAAEEGGDGTEEAPYVTIQRGLNRAGALGGGQVAVAAGTYPETLAFTTDHADVHLAGRCREMVVIDASVGDEETPGISIVAGYGAVEVSGVTVRDSSYVGLVVASGDVLVWDAAISGSTSWGGLVYQSGFGGVTELIMEGCLVEENTDVGLLASAPGTQVILRDTTVREGGGRGINVQEGATLSAVYCLIDGNTELGLSASSPSTQVILRDTTVMDTRPNGNGESGWGIVAQDGATLSAEGCLIDGNTELGLMAYDPGTQISIRDTTVMDTRPNGNGGGRGIEVSDGATLSAEGCLIDGNTELGLHAGNPGTQISIRDTTVMDTRPNGNGQGGQGIEVSDGGTLSAEGCLIDGNTERGLLIGNMGTYVTLRKTTIRDTRPNGNGQGGQGIEVSDGGTLSAEGCLIDGNTEIGIFAVEPGTSVTLQDSTISHTKPGTDLTESAASGVSVQDGAFISASFIDVLSNQGPGLIVNGDGALTKCIGCTIQDNQFAGAIALAGGKLSISDSTIKGTTPSINLLGGAGIYAWPWYGDPTTVNLINTIIRDNPVAGVWLIGDGTYVLIGNTISGGIGEPFGAGRRCGDAILARDGVMAWDGTSGLLLEDNEFLDASGAGIFLDDSSALMSGNTYSGNTMDLVVQNQSCDPIPGYYSEAPHRDLCPLYSYPTCYAEFFFVAMPADPVDWEEVSLRPKVELIRPAIAGTARPIRPILPSARSNNSSYHPSPSR